jgi:hypothetical protein
MTLPYADKPDKSNVYRTLSNKQVKTLGARDFDIVREPIFTDYPNEDELRRLGLVARNGGMAQGGPPLSNSGASFGVALANNEGFIKIPEGQVWSLTGFYIGQAATGPGIELEIGLVSMEPTYGTSSETKIDAGQPLSAQNQAFGTSNYGTTILQTVPLLLLLNRITPFAANIGEPLTLTYPFAIQFKHVNYSSGLTKISGYMNRLR